VTDADDTFECEVCDAVVEFGDARRAETMDGLDPTKWQTLCYPACGGRLKTVFVGDE